MYPIVCKAWILKLQPSVALLHVCYHLLISKLTRGINTLGDLGINYTLCNYRAIASLNPPWINTLGLEIHPSFSLISEHVDGNYYVLHFHKN